MNRAIAAVVATLAFAGGCDAFAPETPNLMTQPDVERPETDVQLPPVPSLDLVDLPRQYDDGTWSVTGLWLERDEALDQDIRVTALVDEIYVCDVEPTAEELAEEPPDEDELDPLRRDDVRPGCLRPHLYVVDDARSPRRLLVTGYRAWHWEPQLRAGQPVIVEGRFQQQARGFISSEEGLMVATGFAGDGLLPLPDPAEVDAGE